MTSTHTVPVEQIPLEVHSTPEAVNKAVANEIANLIRAKAAQGANAILGLATGSTPTGVYAELIRMHREEKLSFRNVVTFNLDEYFPMQPNSLQSYHRFMHEHFFDHVDIDKRNIHIPDGTLAASEVNDFCRKYELAIREAGGLDLQLLGIGRTGHVGFNEPGSGRESRTRLITLDQVTRLDAASDFFGEQYVPRRAITMGVGTILEARRLVMIAFGENKAAVVAKSVEGPVTTNIPATFLQQHVNAKVFLDPAAAAELTRQKSPWLLGLPVEWDKATIKRSVIWLAQRVKKSILKLVDEDYNEHGLQDLLAAHGSAYDINREVFRSMTQTITGWPGGKPEERKRPGDLTRPGDDVFPKRVLIFSPHPDDDVISMGGTLIRLVDQGHEVNVAYQTSGNIAVFDADALRFADFAAEFNKLFGIAGDAAAKLETHIEAFLRNKQPGQIDSPEIQKIKGLIRRGECRAAGRDCGVPVERLHFMDLPFYETGAVRKKPLGAEDIQLTVELLEKIKPHQVYAAGDLSDPHGTHRVCLAAVFRAMERVKTQPWAKQCQVWLYRGAWQEWGPEQIEMAVPLSPAELSRKRSAIFKHQSQKDRAMFPGSDKREFWQRAEDRNRDTARVYDQLGLADYEAVEGFVHGGRAMREVVRLGIDIGGTSVKAALFAGDTCTRTGQSPFYARPTTAELHAAIRAAAGDVRHIDHVGLCVPGLMNAERSRVEASVNVPGLVDIELNRLVPDALGIEIVHPPVISNDAVSTARDIARSRKLSGRLLVITLGTGVGAAVLDNGVPLNVEGGSPGHLGQIDVSIAGHDVVGPDGGAGGLEGYIGVAALRRQYGPDVSAALAAFDGSEPAVAALVRTIRIAHALYRPHHVCLCGGIGTRLRHLLPAIERQMNDRLTSVARPGAMLSCGDDDFHAAHGAAWL